ncbi:thiamine pyrophosphate-dependent enzyme [Nonomuraea sp. NPDC050022]|uniref:thiamine pyrophosphate-dependent enzyme n=1 Tax=Nonomuraea sp. NPDC050022 TaxID=3364358 RepID=UPI00378F8741
MPPKPHVLLNQWDFVKLANSLGVRSTHSVDTAAELDQALATVKTSTAPALIVAKVNPRGLPARLP